MLFAETQPIGHFRYLVDADLAGHIVEPDIAGFAKGVGQVHRAVAVFLPAVKTPVAELHVAGAVNGMVFRQAVFQRGQSDSDLEGRSGRILAPDRLVCQRPPRVVHQLLPVLVADPFAEGVRVVRRCRGDTEHGAGMGIHHDNGCGIFVLDPLANHIL